MHDAQPSESPGRYGPHIAVMREMRWSWAQLREAPNDLIDEVMAHMSYQKKWEHKRIELDRQKAKHGK